MYVALEPQLVSEEDEYGQVTLRCELATGHPAIINNVTWYKVNQDFHHYSEWNFRKVTQSNYRMESSWRTGPSLSVGMTMLGLMTSRLDKRTSSCLTTLVMKITLRKLRLT